MVGELLEFCVQGAGQHHSLHPPSTFIAQTGIGSGHHSWPAVSASPGSKPVQTPDTLGPRKKIHGFKRQLEYKGSSPGTLPNGGGVAGALCWRDWWTHIMFPLHLASMDRNSRRGHPQVSTMPQFQLPHPTPWAALGGAGLNSSYPHKAPPVLSTLRHPNLHPVWLQQFCQGALLWRALGHLAYAHFNFNYPARVPSVHRALCV